MKKDSFTVLMLSVALLLSACSSSSTAPVSSSGGDSTTAVSDAGTSFTGDSAGVVDTDPIFEIETMTRKKLLAERLSITDPASYASVDSYEIAPDLSNVVNLHQTQGASYGSAWEQYSTLTKSPSAMRLLAENGFVVTRNGHREYFDEYQTNPYWYKPNFVTTDSLMHAYHLYFAYLLRKTEREYLSDAMHDISKSMLENTKAQYGILSGTEWEDSVKINLAFFAVALGIFEGTLDAYDLPEDIKSLAAQELALVDAAEDILPSPLFGDKEDYTQYKPRGYYDVDEPLKNYFRAMMWYGRRNFKQSEDTLDRSALLMTLALQGDTLTAWESVYAVTGFFSGESDDNTYYDYRPLIDAVYGENITVDDLIGAEDAFASFHALTAITAPPQINSVPITGLEEDRLGDNRGFRFMGQRFTIDAAVFQNLVYDKVQGNSSGKNRYLPDPLDFAAVLGSTEAEEILESEGHKEYANYPEQLQSMKDYVQNTPDSFWTASLYTGWVDTIRPLLAEKGDGYPTFMRSKAWAYKSLETFIGSWTELKHDTFLYNKETVSGLGAPGPDTEYDDRGYVEPEPEVFARLAALSDATAEGLDGLGMLSEEARSDLSRLSSLATRLAVIAEKELKGELPTDEEFDLIRKVGDDIHYFWQTTNQEDADRMGRDYVSLEDFPSAITVGIATNSDTGEVLHAATGDVCIVYAIVPVDGTLRIASGPVFSYYQYVSTERDTDFEWRKRIGLVWDDEDPISYEEGVQPEEKPSWTLGFRMENDQQW